MTPEDQRFLRKVYEKADKARTTRRRAALQCLCAFCAMMFGIALLCGGGSILLCALTGMLWLSSMSALEWVNLRWTKSRME